MQQETEAVCPDTLRFPKFYRYSIAALLSAAIGVLLCFLVVAACWRTHRSGWFIYLLEGLFPLVAIYCAWPIVYREVQNSRLRRQWVQSFEKQVTPMQLRQLLQSESERFVLHIRRYGGSFDANHPAPAVVLEDTQTLELAVVTPTLESTTEWSEAFGVKVIKH